MFICTMAGQKKSGKPTFFSPSMSAFLLPSRCAPHHFHTNYHFTYHSTQHIQHLLILLPLLLFFCGLSHCWCSPCQTHLPCHLVHWPHLLWTHFCLIFFLCWEKNTGPVTHLQLNVNQQCFKLYKYIMRLTGWHNRSAYIGRVLMLEMVNFTSMFLK